jgi:lysophospholipase L1-like esterase
MANQTKDLFFIALSTDSLSMPRPWNHKTPNKDINLATKFTDTYPYLMKLKLVAAFPEMNIEMNNFAARGSGAITANTKALDMFSYLDADISIFQFGITDCWLRGDNFDTPRVTIEQYEKEIKEIMSRKEQYHPEQNSFFIGVVPTNSHMLSKAPNQNKVIAEYNNVLKQNLGSNCHYIDMEAEFEIHGEKILHPDGNHLSNFGHQHISDILTDKISTAINNLV